MKKRLIYSSLIISILAALIVATPPRLRYLALHSLASLESSSIDYHLGDCYCKGRGVERDLKQAEHHYLKAAKRNHAKAMYKLGNLYSHRHGIQKGQEVEEEFWQDIPLDLPAAIKWYGYAAELCYPSAYVRLGYLNRNGVGMPLNYPQAFYWYRKAAKAKSKNGYVWLGYFYSHGLDRDSEWEHLSNCWAKIPENYPKALKFYLKVAQAGWRSAQYLVGFFYSHGAMNSNSPLTCSLQEIPGVPLDYAKAVFWFTKAAEQGHKIAMRKLGYLYLHGGYGIQQNHEKAFAWYQKGANHCDAVSMRKLAYCYEDGIGTKEDIYHALEWYDKAAQCGDEVAKDILNKWKNRTRANFYNSMY